MLQRWRGLQSVSISSSQKTKRGGGEKRRRDGFIILPEIVRHVQCYGAIFAILVSLLSLNMDDFLLRRIQALEEEVAEIRETMIVMRDSMIKLGEVERERIDLHGKEVRTLQTYMELLQKQNDSLFEMVKKLGMRLGLEDAFELEED